MDFLDFLNGVSIGGLSLAKLLSAVVIFFIFLVVIRVCRRLIAGALEKTKLEGTVKGFALTAINALLWIIAAITIAGALSIPTASLVAAVSVAGLALSLSIQNIMANIFSGVTLLINHPFRAGDYVQIGSSSGTVKSISLFYTVLDTADNKCISIPNSDVTSSAVINYSTEPLRRVDMLFQTAYASATDTVRSALLEAASADARVLSDPAPAVHLSAYKSSSIEYTVRMWCRSGDYWSVYYSMNERVREVFDARGIQMTYDHLNVHVVE